ncbi:hypothetical protein Vafri_12683 [Volvox africanus]|uniref:SAND domain-containing protein n=2 Tax=Volvox africanus TaxID=51714 RepID=A0A8J4F1Z2_9CHLO|nr:hypothetical protein Vafri_12683 [Volvox africanus]
MRGRSRTPYMCRCTVCLRESRNRGKSFYPFDFERHAGMGANKRWKNSVRKLGMRNSNSGSGAGASGSTSSSSGTGWVSLGRFMDINGIRCDQAALERSSTQPAPPPPAFVPEPIAATAVVQADGCGATSSMGGSVAEEQPPPAQPPAMGTSTPPHPQIVPVASYSQLGPRHRAVLFPHLPPNIPRIMPPELQGDEMVGHRIRVYWPLDKAYYSGTVTYFNAGSRWPYGVDYDDGDNENVNLNKENWHLDERDRKPLPPALLERILTMSIAAVAANVHPGATVAVPGATAAGGLQLSAITRQPTVAAPAPGLPSTSQSPGSLQHCAHHIRPATLQGGEENRQPIQSPTTGDVGGSAAAPAVPDSGPASPLVEAARSPPPGQSLGQQPGAGSAMSSHQALAAFGAHLALALQTRPCEGVGRRRQQQQQQQQADMGNLVEGVAQGAGGSVGCGERQRVPQSQNHHHHYHQQQQQQQQQSQLRASVKVDVLKPRQISKPLRPLLNGATEMVEVKEAWREGQEDVVHGGVASAADLAIVAGHGNGSGDDGSDMGMVDGRVDTPTDPRIAVVVPRTWDSRSEPCRQEELLQQLEQEGNHQDLDPQRPHHRAANGAVPLSDSTVWPDADKAEAEDMFGVATEADGQQGVAGSEMVGERLGALVDTALAEGIESVVTGMAAKQRAVRARQEVAPAEVVRRVVLARAGAAGDVYQRTGSATGDGGHVNFDGAFLLNVDGGDSHSGDGDLGINESDIQSLLAEAADGAGQETEDLELEKELPQEQGQKEQEQERDLRAEPHVDNGTGRTATQDESEEPERDMPREDIEFEARRDAEEDGAVGLAAGSGESDRAGQASSRQQGRTGGNEPGRCNPVATRGPRAGLAAATVAASGGLDGALLVVCNHVVGAFLLLHQLVACNCSECSDRKEGKRMCWTPIGFEEHAGMRSSKKWKNSIRLGVQRDVSATAQGVTAGMALGEWLDRRGLVVTPRKERRRQMDAAEVDRCIQAPVTVNLALPGIATNAAAARAAGPLAGAIIPGKGSGKNGGKTAGGDTTVVDEGVAMAKTALPPLPPLPPQSATTRKRGPNPASVVAPGVDGSGGADGADADLQAAKRLKQVKSVQRRTSSGVRGEAAASLAGTRGPTIVPGGLQRAPTELGAVIGDAKPSKIGDVVTGQDSSCAEFGTSGYKVSLQPESNFATHLNNNSSNIRCCAVALHLVTRSFAWSQDTRLTRFQCELTTAAS